MILYHYCSVDKFLKILQSGKFWMTDLASTNDSLEIKHGNKVLLQHYLKVTGINQNETFDLERKIESANHAGYAFCMSTKDDSLSQWRGYADDGKGIAIGILVEALKDIKKGYPWYVTGQETYGYEQVIYTEGKVDRVIFESNEVMELIRKKVNLDNVSINDIRTLITENNPDKNFIDLYKNVCIGIAPIAFFIKNHSFKEECEYRIVRRSVLDKIMIFGGGATNIPNLTDVKYFEKNGKIIGYHEYDYKKYNPLREVILGPKCSMSEDEMRYVLTNFQLGNIQIKKSSSSYR